MVKSNFFNNFINLNESLIIRSTIIWGSIQSKLFQQIETKKQIKKIMEQDKDNFVLVQRAKAQINVDCIKVCPFDSRIFAFAFYEQSDTFLGGVSLQYYVKSQKKSNEKQENNQNTQQKRLLQKFSILECGPILHICWLNRKINNKYILIGASRSQKIFIFSVLIDQIDQEATFKLQKQIHIQNGVFCLYIDCFMRNQNSIEVLVSTNESQVFQLQISAQFDLNNKKVYSKHQYAVWTCRINPFTSKRQIVCGDQVSSIYLYNEEGLLIGKNSKAHEQGICDLVFVSANRMFSGGFDGFLNEFDLTNFQNPLRTFKLGGTIWRIIPDKNVKNLLICNPSQKKFQIIDSVSGTQKWNSAAEHGSLAYSADWSENLMLTSSFYDKFVCLWRK